MDREKLDQIILKNDTNDWWIPDLFERNTRHLLPNVLDILSAPPPEAENHNCFIYALGFAKNLDLLTETGGFIYDQFVAHLIEINALEKISNPSEGDFIVYQDLQHYPKNLTHIGVMQRDGSVISKWAWGPLVRHEIWDVPKDFGDTVFYLKKISNERALSLYQQYKKFNTKAST